MFDYHTVEITQKHKLVKRTHIVPYHTVGKTMCGVQLDTQHYEDIHDDVEISCSQCLRFWKSYLKKAPVPKLRKDDVSTGDSLLDEAIQRFIRNPNTLPCDRATTERKFKEKYGR